MKKYAFLASAAIATIISSSAMAEGIGTKNLPTQGDVKITGVVDSVKSEDGFVLKDSQGKVGVDIESNQSTVLKKGDKVTVSGTVDKSVMGTDINASKVDVAKPLSQGIGDVVAGLPGVSTAGVVAFNIGDLPDVDDAKVKVTGTVTDVDNEKEFTLEDDTGTVSVDITSAERAALTEGAEVTVIGTIDKGLIGKNIDAEKVLIVSDANAKAR